ncbi:hypothetical protein SCOR_18220 [Sulfidibacter corallicola]|uniref:Leucine rich repeat variant n=1 Tax=Sulfidibacter corallicola TaxID=2818388 RepID=A0A8A4TVS7_SULCO|nr:hypothetical protein [Sulfidibacter corallicola]QTD53610.1 hypothetical protein J3U87_14240 [Sulfidibacter corallicola]
MPSQAEMIKSWLRLCADPRSSAEQLENAAYWESINQPSEFQIRLAVSKHRSTSSELLAKLSMVNHLPIQIAVAGHQNLSESTAGHLLRKQLRQLRRALASNPRIPVYVMEKLATDYRDVRLCLARNPAIPRSIQSVLAREKDKNVRMTLAKNLKLSVGILERLSKDKVAEVRAMVAAHPNVPLAGLRAMGADRSQVVREAVFDRGIQEFSDDIPLFRELTKIKPSSVAQKAQEHLDYLIQRQKSRNLLETTPPDRAG